MDKKLMVKYKKKHSVQLHNGELIYEFLYIIIQVCNAIYIR